MGLTEYAEQYENVPKRMQLATENEAASFSEALASCLIILICHLLHARALQQLSITHLSTIENNITNPLVMPQIF